MHTLYIIRILALFLFHLSRVEPVYNDVRLYDISHITLDFLWHRFLTANHNIVFPVITTHNKVPFMKLKVTELDCISLYFLLPKRKPKLYVSSKGTDLQNG
jgi:hypothetical protein